MGIDIKDPAVFTLASLKQLIASANDSVNTQFRVTDDGFLFISEDVGHKYLDGIKFRFETNAAGAGYVGKSASKNALWVKRIFKAVNENWSNPTNSLVTSF